MIVVFFGPPGSGKGTQANLLKREKNFIKISTGDLLRKEIDSQSELGLKVKAIIEAGNFVDDSILYSIIEKKMAQTEASYLMDGFPRNIEQAKYFETYLSAEQKTIDHVIFFDTDEDTLIKRLSGREICSVCGTSYNVFFQRPKEENICDVCGHKGLSRRQDDHPDSVRQRLEIYYKVTRPLEDFYEERGLIRRIDASQKADAIYDTIVAILSKNHK